MNKIAVIRSGGQTGADRAALDVARAHGIAIKGWCPMDGWAEDMPEEPGIRKLFPELMETPLADVIQRTRWNVRDSDATLIVYPRSSRKSNGAQLTDQYAGILGKPHLIVRNERDVDDILDWLQDLVDGLDLNVAGPRASECPEVYDITKKLLEAVLKEVNTDEAPDQDKSE